MKLLSMKAARGNLVQTRLIVSPDMESPFEV
jgi:hypothetical protein